MTFSGFPGNPIGVTGSETPSGPFPSLLCATTTNEYAVPLFNPLTVASLDSPVNSLTVFPGKVSITYFVTGDPPLRAGGSHFIVTVLSPGEADTKGGAEGTSKRTSGSVGSEARPFPIWLLATTVNVNSLPRERPFITTSF